MLVPKRLRFEILRRDNYRCRYCGTPADEAPLTIDHVIPQALGGRTVPENLVAACGPCNAGKTSSNPDAPLVADVTEDDIRWGRAMARAAYLKAADWATIDATIRAVDAEWNDWKPKGSGRRKPLPRPDDWVDTIARFVVQGLNSDAFIRLIGITMRNPRVDPENAWNYFCGCCWRTLEDIQDQARHLLRQEERGGDT